MQKISYGRLMLAAALLAVAALPAAAQSSAGSVTLSPLAVDTVTTLPADSAAPPPEPATADVAAVQVGVGTVKFSGLVQAWYSAASGADASTFRLRRAEMKFAGTVTERASWVVAVDPAKALKVNQTYSTVGDQQVVTEQEVNQASLLLQDAYVTVGFGPVDVQAGQFKLPLSREGFEVSSARLSTVERARFISSGKYGLVRDIGVMASAAPVAGVSVDLGLFNGAGEHQNSVDSDERKVVAGRVTASSGVPGLSLGASGAWSAAGADTESRTDRLGADLQLVRGPLMLRGELMRGWDGEVGRLGYYALAGYRVAPALDLTARYDLWDRQLGGAATAAEAREHSYELSVAHAVGGPNTRVQMSILRRDYGGRRAASNELLVNFQTSW